MVVCELRRFLDERKMTIKQLYLETNIGQNTLGRYCNNTWSRFDKEHLDILCKYFGCTSEEMLVHYKDRNARLKAEKMRQLSKVEAKKIEFSEFIKTLSDEDKKEFIKMLND